MSRNARKKQLLEANEDEDKTIKSLEKLLKLNKRKKKATKKISSTFIDDGLDYLLEVINEKEKDSVLFDSEEGEDVPSVKNEPAISGIKRKFEKNSNQCVSKKQRTLVELLEEKEGRSCSSKNDLSVETEDNYDSDSDSSFVSDCKAKNSADGQNDDVKISTISESSSNEKPKKPKLWEDIYGRLRDESGNVIKASSVTERLYVPPNLRKENVHPDEQKSEECKKIIRQVKGLLNRLSESIMQPICSEIEGMYMKNSRYVMNETLYSLMSELLFTNVLTPPRLVMEQAMLITLLHANVGPEVGAFFLQHIVQELDKLFKSSESYGEGKKCNNMLIFLSHLYNYRVTHATLIFDIFRKLIESFRKKDIELIQLFLKNIGFVLRKDDPISLKDIILSIQAKAAVASKEDQNDSRIKFMLETLMAIRNNNMYKIPDYDPSIMEHSKKLLKGLVRKGCSIQELAISYEDLLKADERGRWWIVGSAWSERDAATNNSKKGEVQNTLSTTNVSEKILELARKQHMNTEVRKSVFCIIMTAEDFMDAFEKLLKLNLKHQQEREIINVILHCALHEKNFNPYYAYLAGKFCGFSRKHQMSLQFSLWDKFKEFSKMKEHQMNNLALFLSQMFITGALPLSVLKVIHFSEMNKSMVRFFRKILLAILLHDSEEICCQVFKRIALAKNLNLLREGLRLFMHHFLLRNESKFKPEVAEKLNERVKLAETILNSSKRAFKL